MSYAALKQELIEYSKIIGIDQIGFASAAVFTTLKQRLEIQQQLGYQSGLEEQDIAKRTNPKMLLPEAKSIIAIALAYPSKMENSPKSTADQKRGVFCKASWGLDYHHILRDRLEKLEAFLRERVPGVHLTSMVDTGSLSDRAVAERAGIGWSGKNCAIISPEFGSYIYLGEMITSIPFEPDTPIEDQCGTCNKCVEACPTDALVQGGQINAQRCISFLTQTKQMIPEEFRSKIGNRLYGCDTCQTVCPYNKGIDYHNHPEMEPDGDSVKPLLRPILTLSNREFKKRFGSMAGSWRGKKPIQRNALIALAHFKDKSSVSDLIQLVQNDSRSVIRGTAAWALGKIGDISALPTLIESYDIEIDNEVKIEIDKAIQALKEL
ncbi:tRNA epoxyqueuosine(34) reductase QueG [Bacillus sp. HMF5848]|uniref:tRNA epoxyqueuosine(34) reductase QueG n=1 Tax=Bacillus sp. HMF5848 TaxID=2495421 RepID=UPI000F7B7870|nr:tRNA epoxyqueuosine(34) reductase QueG [Bacillus sp. HMF5848]RSK26168.1 tRNA epoxyqueuosine(34) reductase QueG [Bacillus sp. HMF5848]